MGLVSGSGIAPSMDDPITEMNRWREKMEKEGWISKTPPPPMPAARQMTQVTAAISPASVFKRTSIDPLSLLGDRLRIPRGDFTFKGIDHIHIYAAADKVVVLYYKNGAGNVLEEDAAVFPSDTFVAQFQLIMG